MICRGERGTGLRGAKPIRGGTGATVFSPVFAGAAGCAFWGPGPGRGTGKSAWGHLVLLFVGLLPVCGGAALGLAPRVVLPHALLL